MLQSIFKGQPSASGQARDLEAFSVEVVNEKVRLVEKLRVTEEQNAQMQKDLETLIFRIEELEVENGSLS